jgi:predicted RNA-binding protein Jag
MRRYRSDLSDVRRAKKAAAAKKGDFGPVAVALASYGRRQAEATSAMAKSMAELVALKRQKVSLPCSSNAPR